MRFQKNPEGLLPVALSKKFYYKLNEILYKQRTNVLKTANSLTIYFMSFFCCNYMNCRKRNKLLVKIRVTSVVKNCKAVSK
jgi:hypothetical protein